MKHRAVSRDRGPRQLVLADGVETGCRPGFQYRAFSAALIDGSRVPQISLLRPGIPQNLTSIVL